MDEEAALLRAICEHPDEDTPRLVFADWLQEQGGPLENAWAGAIRAQVHLAAGATDIAPPKLFGSMFGVNRVSARLGVPPDLEPGLWNRGFPTCVSGTFDAVRAAWPHLTARVPFRDLRMADSSDDAVAEFAKWPHLDRLTALDLRSWYRGPGAAPFGEPALLTVAACAALSSLASLKMGYLHLTNSGVAAVLNSPHLRELKALQLRRINDAPTLTWYTQTRLTAAFGPDAVV